MQRDESRPAENREVVGYVERGVISYTIAYGLRLPPLHMHAYDGLREDGRRRSVSTQMV